VRGQFLDTPRVTRKCSRGMTAVMAKAAPDWR